MKKIKVGDVMHIKGAQPWLLGIWGEEPYIFRDVGRRVIYLHEFGEQAQTFGL